MQIKRYHKKRFFIIITITLVILYILMSGKNTFEVDGIIRNTKPEDVWEYVADFNKMKLLNPTIIDFKITADAGTYDHWKYSVVYREKLSYWPYSQNVGHADIAVRKLPKEQGGILLVESKHKTCFLAGLYCLYSTGQFRFSSLGKDTLCIETVEYDCPLFLGAFCHREVEFQRRAIMHNLTMQFHKNKIM